MNSLRHTQFLAAFLMIIGGLIFWNKTARYDVPLMAQSSQTVWDFELFIDFNADNRPVRVQAFLPIGTQARQVSEEQFYNGAFGLQLGRDEEKNRVAIWTYRYPNDRKVLRYQARIVGYTPEDSIPGDYKLTRAEAFSSVDSALERQAFTVWLSDLRRQSADDESLASLVMQQLFERQLSDEVEALLPKAEPPLDRLMLARDVLASQKIPTRIVNGIYLDQERRRADLKRWIEYRVGGTDKRYFIGESPDLFFPIWYGTEEYVQSQGAQELSTQISFSPAIISGDDYARLTGLDSKSILGWFSFDRLPLTTQLVYGVMVTIPVGIALLVFLRQFIGFQTLGTFMPVLIGIAFRETALLNGLFLFSALIALGLAARFYLERLKLLLVPRLAVVLIFIVICMAAISLIMSGSGQRVGLSISLFPMVILTMTIERMSVVWEEYDAVTAIKQGVGSLIIASLSYLVMSNPRVEYLMFTFPELLLVLLGLCLLMGKYTGLRLSEFIRFRELAAKS